MSTTIKTATRSIGTYGRHAAYLSYSTSSSATSTTITVGNMGEYFSSTSSSSSTYSTSGTSTVKYSLNGTTKSTHSKSGLSATVSSSSGKYISFGSGTSTSYTRGTSADTVTLKLSWTWNGTTSTKSVSVTIPALESWPVYCYANGGTGSTWTGTKYYGKSLTLATSTNAGSKSGYSFMGWGTSASATSASYGSGGSYTSNAGASLYAIWRKTITITLNANGGSGGTTSLTGYAYNNNTTTTITLPNAANSPTRSGYTFLGWSTSSTATSASYTAGSSYSFSSSTTLYAIWRKTITITYNYNGSGQSNATATNYAYNANTSASFTIPSTTGTNAATWTDHVLLGWSTSSSATSSSYTPCSSYSFSSSQTLYAVWAHPVTLNANNGTLNSGVNNSYNIPVKTGTIDLSNKGATRNGYDYAGWASSSTYNGSGSQSSSYTISAKTTLYTVWRKTITITLNANGGSGGTASLTGYSYNNNNTTITLPNAQNSPTRAGYQFLGWAATASASTAEYEVAASYTTTENKTLYAVWYPLYVLTYNANGAVGTPPSSFQGAQVVLPNPTGLTKAGYECIGWSTNPNATTTNVVSIGTTFTFESDTTLYAIWRKTIRITYNLNGLQINGSAPSNSEQTIYNNQSLPTFNLATITPSDSAYQLIGWAITSNAETSDYTNGQQNVIFENSITLYAIYKVCYKLVLNPNATVNGNYVYVNGMNNPANVAKIITGIYYNGIIPTFTLTTPYKEYYSFSNWNTASNGSGVSYNGNVSGNVFTTTNDSFEGYDSNISLKKLELYARFGPIYVANAFNQVIAIRTNDLGIEADDGTYGVLTFTITLGTTGVGKTSLINT